MKAKTVRLLAGGLAAVTLMSNMAVMPVFADEAHTYDTVATETMVEETYDAGETQSIEDFVNEDNHASEETETEAENRNAEQEAGEASAQLSTEENTEAEDAQGAEKADESADVVNAETAEAGKAQDMADTVNAEDANETQNQTEDAQTSDESSDKTEAAKKTENTDLISAQDAEDADLLSAGDEEEPVLGSAPVTETQEVKEAGKAAEAREKQAREVAAKLTADVKSCDDILKILDSLDTIKKFSAENHAAYDTNNKSTSAETELDKTCRDIFKEAIGTAVKKACDCIPGGGIFESLLKDLAFDYLGLNESEDEKKPDTNDKIDQLGGEVLRGMENVGSIGIYGTRLDAFKDSASDLSSKMELIKSNPSMTENEKNVRIAALIGGSENWYIGGENIFAKMNAASQTMRSRSHEGSMSDAKERNLFDIFYDYNKETSMFSGEAMAKANVSISKRTGQYGKDCKVLLSVLKAHEKVADMSEAEAAKLSPDAKKVYDKIKTDKGTIRMQMKGIIETFTGNKNSTDVKRQIGIFDALKEYNEKDKLVFLEKKGAGFNEIKMHNKAHVQKSEEFDVEALKYYSSLSKSQVKNLQEHVNSLGISMSQYLKMVGIDLSDVKDKNRSVYLSTLEKTLDNGRGVPGSTCGVVYDKVFKGYDINKVGAQESAKIYKYYGKDDFNSDAYNITLRSQKDVDDELARIKAEKARKEAEEYRKAEEERIRELNKIQDICKQPDAQEQVQQVITYQNNKDTSILGKVKNFFKNLFS